MNQRNFILLGLAIASMLMLSWFQSNSETIEQDSLLLPKLKGSLDSLSRVEITTSAGSFSMVKDKADWMLIERDSYPINFPVLSKLLNGLSVARLIEKKTSKPENFESLQLNDVSEKDSDAVIVSGFAQGFEFSVFVGKQAFSRQGQFVRMSGESQAWLIDEELQISGDIISWLNPVLINIDSDQVTRVEQYDANGALLFEVERGEGETSLVLKNMPPERSLKYPSIVDELGRSLVNVRLTDVSAHDPLRWKSPTRMKFSLQDGNTISVSAEKVEGRRWLHLTGGDAYADKEMLSSWDYEVSSYVYEDYTIELGDLLNEEPGI